jgi:ribosome maturation factor RimP
MGAAQDSELASRLAELGEEAAIGSGIEVAEVQLRGTGKARLLRVYIDKPSGVTHQDCELISHRLGKLLDEKDILPGDSYTLEVSSLGVERKLSTPRDFARVVGKKIAVTTRDPISGNSYFEGKLIEADAGRLQVEVREGDVLELPLDRVLRAKLKFDW